MFQFTDDQKHEILSLIQQNRKVEAIKLTREISNLGLKEAKDFVELLIENPEALYDFLQNTQRESKVVEYNFSSSKIKFTDRDGKTFEIDDQHPEWHAIQKNWNVDLSQPDAIQNFIKQFAQHDAENRHQAYVSHHSKFTQNDNPSVPNAGIEDLSKNDRFGRILRILAAIFLIGLAYIYISKKIERRSAIYFQHTSARQCLHCHKIH